MDPLQEMARIRPQHAVVKIGEEALSHADRQRWEKDWTRTGHIKGMSIDGSSQIFNVWNSFIWCFYESMRLRKCDSQFLILGNGSSTRHDVK